MARLVSEIAQDFCTDLHFQATALLAIQEAMESLISQAYGGHEPLCNSCQVGYHPTKGFEAGALYQSQQWW